MSEEVVIFVHGTFASSESDTGERWWQKGSRFAQALASRLDENISVDPGGRVFRWSGENSWAARHQAANELGRHLRSFEDEGRKYHLVAHSHGGNVVWDLIYNEGGHDIVPVFSGLRSVTTVGTPFIRSGGGRLGASLEPLFGFYGLLALIGPPMLGMLVLLALSEDKYDLSTGAAVLGAFVTLAGWMVAFGPPYWAFLASETLKVRARNGAYAVARIGSRYLALWSEDDEAIQGLQAAASIDAPILRARRMAPANPFIQEAAPQLYAVQRFLSLLFLAPFRMVYARLFAPLGDRFIWSALRGRAFGLDAAGVRLEGVGVCPPHGFTDGEPLPPATASSLRSASDQAIAASPPALRGLLRHLATDGLAFDPPVLGDDDASAGMLVHNLYFDSEDVQDLIAAHITANTSVASPARELRPDLSEFLERSHILRTRDAGVAAEQVAVLKKKAWHEGAFETLKFVLGLLAFALLFYLFNVLA